MLVNSEAAFSGNLSTAVATYHLEVLVISYLRNILKRQHRNGKLGGGSRDWESVVGWEALYTALVTGFYRKGNR
jgi:hypothetical protein